MNAHRIVAVSLIALLGSASGLSAHCRVDAPNGGEVLRMGARITVRWTELVAHGAQYWHVHYSVSGARGPWLPVATNLPNTARSYVWSVPQDAQAASSRVRIRVTQDMGRYQIRDVSDADCSIVASLKADVGQVSLASGGAQNIVVDAGARLAGRRYLVLGSARGTAPGLQIGAQKLPLNADGYLFATLQFPNAPPLVGSLGKLDARGRGSARFALPRGLPTSLRGLVLHHACVVFDASSQALELISNAVAVSLVR